MKKRLFLILDNQAFSIIGTLTAVIIGLIVMAGLTQLTVNINLDVQKLKDMANSIQLSAQLDKHFNKQCKEKLTNTIGLDNLDNLFKGDTSSLPKLEVLRDEKETPGEHFKLTENNMKNAYNLRGLSRFVFKCAEDSCNCSKTKNTCYWHLILSTTVFNNNLPTFKNIHTIPLKISYILDSSNQKTKTQFICGLGSSQGNKSSKTKKDPRYENEDPPEQPPYIRSKKFKIIATNEKKEEQSRCTSDYIHFNNPPDRINEEGFGMRVWAISDSRSPWNSFFGYYAGYKNTSSKNAYFGVYAGYSNGYTPCNLKDDPTNSGSENSFFGYEAGSRNRTGNKNTFVGQGAGHANTTGTNNTYIGDNAGEEGSYNVFVGSSAGSSNKANYNSFFGVSAGYKNSTGEKNVFIGSEAGKFYKNQSNNTFVGYRAGGKVSKKLDGGENNSFFGSWVGYNQYIISDSRKNNNVLMGSMAGTRTKNGDNNTFVGYQAGTVNTNGSSNTFLGYKAGVEDLGREDGNLTGNFNTYIGFEAGKSNETGNHNIVIGAGADINNGNTGKTLIKTGSANTKEFARSLYFQENSNVCNGFFCVSFFSFMKKLSKPLFNQNNDEILNSWNLNQSISFPHGEKNHHLNIGSYVRGEMKGSTLKVANHEIVPATSRKYKMDIKKFISYNEALKDITDIPLYTFRYKEWERFPWKKRMDIISENMPLKFQLPLDGVHTQVDMPTLTGSMIASIKALDYKVKNLEQTDNKALRTLASLDKDFKISGRKICLEGGVNCLLSSKKLKKDIKEFKENDKALEKIVKIKLFSYKFKDKKVYTDKKRMGVISEELPEKFQVLMEGELSKPDWPSLTGYIISSIKALYGKVRDMSEKIEDLYKQIKDLKEVVEKNKLQREKTHKEFKMSFEEQMKKMDERLKALETGR